MREQITTLKMDNHCLFSPFVDIFGLTINDNEGKYVLFYL